MARGLRNFDLVSGVVSTDATTVSLLPPRVDPVRLDAERRAVFRSTTREADEVSGAPSDVTLLMRLRPVALSTSMTFAREARAWVLAAFD